jgi:hypothetical protein
VIYIYNLNQPLQPKVTLELGRDYQRGGGHSVVKYVPSQWWCDDNTRDNNNSNNNNSNNNNSSSNNNNNNNNNSSSNIKNNSNNNIIKNTNKHMNSNNNSAKNILPSAKNVPQLSKNVPRREYLLAGGSDGCVRLWSYPDRSKRVIWEISNTICSNSNIPIIDIELIPHIKGITLTLNQSGILCFFNIFVLEKTFAIEAPKCLKRIFIFEKFYSLQNVTSLKFNQPLVTHMKFVNNDYSYIYIFTQNNQTYRYSIHSLSILDANNSNNNNNNNSNSNNSSNNNCRLEINQWDIQLLTSSYSQTSKKRTVSFYLRCF